MPRQEIERATKPLRVGVLVSGRGSNLGAILDAISARKLDVEVAVVVSDRADAPALARLAGSKVHGLAVLRSAFADTAEFEAKIADELDAAGVELVVLAGFMRILSPAFIRRFPQRIINIHPSLLPAFPGLHAQRQALEYGVKISGCTVHFVNEQVDGGAIIAQAAVPVCANDTEESLGARILTEEHRLLPEVVAGIAAAKNQRKGIC